MTKYIVSYDLRRIRNYQPLINQLTAWGAQRLLESFWLLDTVLSFNTIHDQLIRLMDGDDGLAVIEMKPGTGWMTTRAKPEGTSWLQAKFPVRTAA